MKFSTIFLDMDGILSNFHLEAVRCHIKAGRRLPHIFQADNPLQLKNPQLEASWPRGLSLQKYMGQTDLGKPKVSQEEFWEPINRDPCFWRLIPPYDNFKEVVKLCQTHAHEVVITTHAHHTPSCHAGKREWLDLHGLGDFAYITIRQKWRLADPTCLILDDFEQHIKDWRRELRKRWGIEGVVIPPANLESPKPIGCFAILYPQPWNANHQYIHRQLEYVEERIRFYLEPRHRVDPHTTRLPLATDMVRSGPEASTGETGAMGD